MKLSYDLIDGFAKPPYLPPRFLGGRDLPPALRAKGQNLVPPARAGGQLVKLSYISSTGLPSPPTSRLVSSAAGTFPPPFGRRDKTWSPQRELGGNW